MTDPQKPWLRGGAADDQERRAAEVLRRARVQEQAVLARVQKGRVSAALAQRLAEGEWPARKKAPWLWLGVAVAVGLVAVVMVRTRASSVGTVVSGEVLAREGAHERRLKAGDRFASTESLTAGQSGVEVRLASRATLMLSAGAVATVSGPQVELTTGVARAQVEKRGAGESAFKVRAGEVTVVVVGTRFEVENSPETGVRVSVEEGRVRVEGQGAASMLEAGRTWRSKGDSQFELAARLVQSGHLDEARALYVKLAESTVGSAETALYLHARLEMREFHDPARALELLTTLERRFPGGALAREAQQSKLEALVLLKRCEAARGALRDLQRAFPSEGLDERALGAECQP